MAAKPTQKRPRPNMEGAGGESSRLNQVEKPVQESEEIINTLWNKSFSGIYVVQDGQFKSINPSAAACAGYSVEELIGKNSEMLIHPEDLDELRENSRAMLRGERSTPYVFRIMTGQGEIRRVMETVTAISYEGRPAILGNSIPVVPPQWADESLKESVQRLASIIDFLPDATFAIDRAGKVIIWNRAMEELTGLKASDILGKGDYEYALPFYGIRRPILVDQVLSPNTLPEMDLYQYVKKEDGLLIAETELLTLNNTNFIFWGKAGPLFDSNGNCIGAIETVREITERKQMEVALKKREADLKVKTQELEDLNAALRVLLKQRNDDQKILEENVLYNIKRLIFPHIDKLRGKVDAGSRSYINVLESNLKDIMSPFAQKMSVQFLSLTNREVQIANLIKEGLSTKEIASFLNVSESAINLHRYRIRHKLSLTKGHNLRSYLSSLS
ncbi:MAG TPA: PAS domain S-box protein [Methylomicrobium sp.]|jgi:PAS domain S-box-containing protein|nr:PAS domain S-box protein [Methylomicrobium sp.]